MKQILYIPPIVLLSLLFARCVNEEILPSPPEEIRNVQIIFNTSPYTKSDQDNVTSIHLWGFAHQANGSIANFIQLSTTTSYSIDMDSKFFERNDRGVEIAYTNLYAIANVDRLNPINGVGEGKFSTLDQYTKEMNQIQKNYIQKPNSSPPISLKQEKMLEEITTQNTTSTNADMNTPLMMSTYTVRGGASMVVMPLQRIYCRIWFTFIITGNPSDNVTINSIHLNKLNGSSYVFEERYLSPAGNEYSWDAPASGERVFKNNSDQYYAQPLSPGSTFTLCSVASSPTPYYFYSYQSIGESEDFDPAITLNLTNQEGNNRSLTAPLYDPSNTDGKKYHGLLRNHSYQVISTISSGTLKLEDLTVRSHDWFDRGEVEFPPFE